MRQLAMGLLLLTSGLAGCGPDTNPAAAAGEGTTVSSPATGWKSVQVFQGDGSKPVDTKVFDLSGDSVRFVYTVRSNSSGPVPFVAQLFPEGAPVGASELHRASCADCKGEETDEAGMIKAGRYYLHVTTSRPWALRVVEKQ